MGFLQASSMSLNPCPADRHDSGAFSANPHVNTQFHYELY